MLPVSTESPRAGRQYQYHPIVPPYHHSPILYPNINFIANGQPFKITVNDKELKPSKNFFTPITSSTSSPITWITSSWGFNGQPVKILSYPGGVNNYLAGPRRGVGRWVVGWIKKIVSQIVRRKYLFNTVYLFHINLITSSLELYISQSGWGWALAVTGIEQALIKHQFLGATAPLEQVNVKVKVTPIKLGLRYAKLTSSKASYTLASG